MAGKTIGAKIVLDGEKEYKQAITGINSSMKVLDSELKMVSAQFADNANTVEATAAKSEVYNKMIDSQKAKISELQSALDNSKSNYTRAAENVENWKQKLVEAQNALEAFKNSSSATSDEIKEQENVVAGLSHSVSVAEGSMSAATNSVNRWQTSLNEANTDLATTQRALNSLATSAADFNNSSQAVSGFAQAIQDCNARISVSDTELNQLSAELKLVNAQYASNSNGAEATARRVRIYTEQIAIQENRIRELRSALEAATNEYGANSIAVSQWRLRLTQAETALQSTQNELTSLNDELGHTDTAIADATSSSLSLSEIFKANLFANLAADAVRNLGDELVDFAKQGIELASNLQEVQNVVDVTFGDGAQEIYDFSKTAAESFGLSALSAQQYAGTLGAMVKSAGLADEQAQEMSIAITQLAGDMASFHNIDTDTAFQKLRSGISGETEPLKQLGINLSVANLEAYAMSQGIETAWKSMSQAEQTTLRYNYLMQATADAQGDFSRTSNSLANQQRILQLNLQNVQAELGQALLPSLNEMLQKTNDALSNGAETKQVIDDVVNVLTTLGGIVAKTTEFLYDNRKALGYVAGGLAAITAALKIQSIIQAAVAGYTALAASLGTTTIAQTALNVAMDANPIGLVIAAVTALIAVYDLLTVSFKEMQENSAESMQEYENAKQQFESTKTEIEDNTTALKGLQEQWDKGFRTQDLADQLNTLTDTTEELKAQLKIEEELAKTKQRQAEEDVLALMNSSEGFEAVDRAMENYIGLEKQRDESAKEAAEARLSGDIETAELMEENVRLLDEQIEQSKEYKEYYRDSLVEAAAALSEQAEKIDGVTEAGQKAKEKAEEYAENVLKVIGAWDDVPDEVQTKYTITREESLVSSVMQMGGFSTDYNIPAQTEDLEELETALNSTDTKFKTHKITEADYWKERQDILNKYRDEDSEEWWKYQDEVTSYYDDIAKKSQESAEEQSKAQQKAAEEIQKAQEKADKERLEAIEKQNMEELEAWENGAEETAKALEEAYSDLTEEKEKTRKELLDIDLTDTVTNDKGKEVTVLNDLSAEKQKMLAYQKSIEELKKTGIADSLLSEIGNMDYQSGEQQNYINSLLGLSPESLQKYYSDWAAVQATAEQVSQSMVQEDLNSLNQKTASAVTDIFGSMPKSAYAQGQETAQSYLQGIVDSMTGVNSSADISTILGKTTATTSVSQQKTVPISTPINFYIDGKKAISATLEELLKNNRLTGGNNINL